MQSREANIDNAILSERVNNLKLGIDNKVALHVAGTEKTPPKWKRLEKTTSLKNSTLPTKKGTATVTAVAKQMADSRMKNRAAFYYLFKKNLA